MADEVEQYLKEKAPPTTLEIAEYYINKRLAFDSDIRRADLESDEYIRYLKQYDKKLEIKYYMMAFQDLMIKETVLGFTEDIELNEVNDIAEALKLIVGKCSLTVEHIAAMFKLTYDLAKNQLQKQSNTSVVKKSIHDLCKTFDLTMLSDGSTVTEFIWSQGGWESIRRQLAQDKGDTGQASLMRKVMYPSVFKPMKVPVQSEDSKKHQTPTRAQRVPPAPATPPAPAAPPAPATPRAPAAPPAPVTPPAPKAPTKQPGSAAPPTPKAPTKQPVSAAPPAPTAPTKQPISAAPPAPKAPTKQPGFAAPPAPTAPTKQPVSAAPPASKAPTKQPGFAAPPAPTAPTKQPVSATPKSRPKLRRVPQTPPSSIALPEAPTERHSPATPTAPTKASKTPTASTTTRASVEEPVESQAPAVPEATISQKRKADSGSNPEEVALVEVRRDSSSSTGKERAAKRQKVEPPQPITKRHEDIVIRDPRDLSLRPLCSLCHQEAKPAVEEEICTLCERCNVYVCRKPWCAYTESVFDKMQMHYDSIHERLEDTMRCQCGKWKNRDGTTVWAKCIGCQACMCLYMDCPMTYKTYNDLGLHQSLEHKMGYK